MTYELTTLTIKRGKMDEFSKCMSHLIPAVEAQGWKLIWAGEEKIGYLNRVYDLFAVPDANAVHEVETKMAPYMEAHPELVDAYAKIAEIVLEERISICDALPYMK